MNRVQKILMDRDGYTAEEARRVLLDGRTELHEAIADGDGSQDIEDLFSDIFGLEPDYLFDVL